MNVGVGIELDPNNKTLWSALKACEAAFAADKKHRFAAAEVGYIGMFLAVTYNLSYHAEDINSRPYIYTYIYTYKYIHINT